MTSLSNSRRWRSSGSVGCGGWREVEGVFRESSGGAGAEEDEEEDESTAWSTVALLPCGNGKMFSLEDSITERSAIIGTGGFPLSWLGKDRDSEGSKSRGLDFGGQSLV